MDTRLLQIPFISKNLRTHPNGIVENQDDIVHILTINIGETI